MIPSKASDAGPDIRRCRGCPAGCNECCPPAEMRLCGCCGRETEGEVLHMPDWGFDACLQCVLECMAIERGMQ